MPRSKPTKVQRLTLASSSSGDGGQEQLSGAQLRDADAVANEAAAAIRGNPQKARNAAAVEAAACQDPNLKYWLEKDNQPVSDNHLSRWMWKIGNHAQELFATMFHAALEPNEDVMAGPYKWRALMALRKGPDRLIFVSDGALRAQNMRSVKTLLRDHFQDFFGPQLDGPAPPGHAIHSAVPREGDDLRAFRDNLIQLKVAAKRDFERWRAAGHNVFWKYNATSCRRGVFVMNEVEEFDRAWDAISKREAYGGPRELYHNQVDAIATGDEIGGAMQLGIPTHPDLGNGKAGTVRVYLVYDPELKKMWFHKDTIKNLTQSNDAEGAPITGQCAQGTAFYDIEQRERGDWLWKSPQLKSAVLDALRKTETRLKTTILPEVDDASDLNSILYSSHNKLTEARAKDRCLCFMAADIVISNPTFETDEIPHAYVIELNFPMPLEEARLCYYPRTHLVEEFFAGRIKAGLPNGVPWWPWDGVSRASGDEIPDINNEQKYLRVS